MLVFGHILFAKHASLLENIFGYFYKLDNNNFNIIVFFCVCAITFTKIEYTSNISAIYLMYPIFMSKYTFQVH